MLENNSCDTNKCKRSISIFQLAAGFSFLSILCLLIETHLSVDEHFLVRVVLGSLIGIIYLTSIIGRLQINLSLFTGFFTIATITSITQTKTSPEIISVSLILVYSLIALNLSSFNCLFLESYSNFVVTNVEFGALSLIVKQTKSLIYLAGAKLLTTFCYFLPFTRIASQILVHPNVLHSNVSKDISNEFVVLFFSRLALGTITILIVRHNVHYLSTIYVMPIAILFATMLLIPLFDLRHLTECSFVFFIILTLYVAFSLTVDVIGHRVALNPDFDLGFIPKAMSLTFATFNEHLVDVLFMVVYLNDLINAKMILTSLAIISLSSLSYKLTTSFERDRRAVTNKNIL